MTFPFKFNQRSKYNRRLTALTSIKNIEWDNVDNKSIIYLYFDVEHFRVHEIVF